MCFILSSHSATYPSDFCTLDRLVKYWSDAASNGRCKSIQILVFLLGNVRRVSILVPSSL